MMVLARAVYILGAISICFLEKLQRFLCTSFSRSFSNMKLELLYRYTLRIKYSSKQTYFSDIFQALVLYLFCYIALRNKSFPYK